MRCSDTAIVYLDDVRVPAKNIIGDPGMGFTYQMLQFQEERLACAALSTSPLDTVIAETIEYTKQRKAFGQPIISTFTFGWRNFRRRLRCSDLLFTELLTNMWLE